MPVFIILCFYAFDQHLSSPVSIAQEGPRRTEKRIRKRDGVNLRHGRIIHKFRIDEKKHRHIHRLPRIQPLLLEAKTLYLAEIRRHLRGRDAVRSYADDVFAAFVCGGVERQSGFARQDPDFALLRGEFPGEDVGDGAVKGDAQAAGVSDGGKALGWI